METVKPHAMTAMVHVQGLNNYPENLSNEGVDVVTGIGATSLSCMQY